MNYKLPGEKCFRSVERPIHGIAVIVPIEEQGEIKEDSCNDIELDPNAVEFHPIIRN